MNGSIFLLHTSIKSFQTKTCCQPLTIVCPFSQRIPNPPKPGLVTNNNLRLANAHSQAPYHAGYHALYASSSLCHIVISIMKCISLPVHPSTSILQLRVRLFKFAQVTNRLWARCDAQLGLECAYIVDHPRLGAVSFHGGFLCRLVLRCELQSFHVVFNASGGRLLARALGTEVHCELGSGR